MKPGVSSGRWAGQNLHAPAAVPQVADLADELGDDRGERGSRGPGRAAFPPGNRGLQAAPAGPELLVEPARRGQRAPGAGGVPWSRWLRPTSASTLARRTQGSKGLVR